MSKKSPSQVVLVRRKVEAMIDIVADEIAERRGQKHRCFISVYGHILAPLDKILAELQQLQCSNQKHVTPGLRTLILEANKNLPGLCMAKQFEEILDLI